MSTKTIEQEVAELKKRVARLEKNAALKPDQRWREAVGMIEPSELTREAARLGAEWRAKENKRR